MLVGKQNPGSWGTSMPVFANSCVYDVPYVAQQSNQTCWYAAARMIVEYHRNKMRQTTLEGGAIGQDWANKLVADQNNYILWANVETFARQFGFKSIYLCPTSAGLVDLLRYYGPLWYGGDWAMKSTPVQPTASGHVITIRGCTAVGPTGTVYVNDPWPKSGPLEIAFDQLFRTLSAVDVVPFLYLP